MLEMLSPCFTIDEDIIKEYKNEVLQVGKEYFIHQFLECGRIISEAYRHDENIRVATMCVEIHFRDIMLVKLNLAIPRTKIQLGEKMSIMKLIQKLINNRNWNLSLIVM